MKKWEIMVVEKRKEFKKSLPHLEEQKKDIIKNKILENSFISLEELDQYLGENGMLGLSLREKLDILRKQLSLMVALYRNYSKKRERLIIYFLNEIYKFLSAHVHVKLAKYEKKMNELEKRIANTKKLQEDLKNNYSSIYKEENI